MRCDARAAGITRPTQVAGRGHEGGSIRSAQADLGFDTEGSGPADEVVGFPRRRWVGHEEPAPCPVGQGMPDRSEVVQVLGGAGHEVDADRGTSSSAPTALAHEASSSSTAKGKRVAASGASRETGLATWKATRNVARITTASCCMRLRITAPESSLMTPSLKMR